LHVPGLFYAEVGNALWKLVRFAGYRTDAAEKALDRIAQMNLRSTGSQHLLADAFALAATYHRSDYDCIYVALGLSLSAPMLTCDEKLVNAMGTRFPVRWIGARGAG
jgi:predicted nucleic acid-binding protein